MTKTEIVDNLTRKTGIQRKVVLSIVDGFLENIQESIENDNSVEIRGFGTFYKSVKKPRKVHSPIAGKVIDVPARSNIGFKPSKVSEKEL